MKNKVLELLRRKQGFVSGQEMSAELGVSRAAVWKAVEALRKEGYAIDSAPNRGYHLAAATGELSKREILAALGDCPWKDTLEVFETIDSTNNRCKVLGSDGAPAGTVLVADCQTGGRGRLGRSFLSPPHQGVYLSVLLRPQVLPMELMHLTCAVAEAMCDAVEAAAGFRPGIKWTNDLVSGKKKLAGILTELSLEAESGQVQYAVVGIGINCAQREEDFAPEIRDMAGSLSMISGKPVDRNLLAAEMVKALWAMDQNLVSGRQGIMEGYRRDCITLGQQVSVSKAGEVRYGKALDVDGWGGLVVDFDGRLETVQAGEVSVRGMYGYV